ncbi:MAG: acetyl-CoA carboxylase biotin carboxyl carrier protein [Verrucomicrobia bacterium]|nr:acetyl-CoA carboxylase biotin carboxyl carrier protein [Verrucomicrobiota bacterium]MBV9274197.1 acetyl-CoA carboxylase biotin carboxyl carrier protein [Verrucomicrobiota bacterium]
MELDDIKAIIDLMKQNDLAFFKLEREGFKIELEAHRSPVASAPPAASAPLSGPVHAGPVPANITESSISTSGKATSFKEIVSPMVGTFYRAASPDSAPYVEVGQEINEETVVCIIEAMKVMNEIKAEVKGTVFEILLENGTAVQFGQPLIRVK